MNELKINLVIYYLRVATRSFETALEMAEKFLEG